MALTNLNEILHKHKLWLNSDKDGQRAVFKDMDLMALKSWFCGRRSRHTICVSALGSCGLSKVQ